MKEGHPARDNERMFLTMDRKTRAIIKTINAILQKCKKDKHMSYYNIGVDKENYTEIVTDSFRVFETKAMTDEATPDAERTSADTFIINSLKRAEENATNRQLITAYSVINEYYKEIKKDKIKDPVINFDNKFTLDLKLFTELLQSIETQTIYYKDMKTAVYFEDDTSKAAIMPKVKIEVDTKTRTRKYKLASSDEYIFIDNEGHAHIIDTRHSIKEMQIETA